MEDKELLRKVESLKFVDTSLFGSSTNKVDDTIEIIEVLVYRILDQQLQIDMLNTKIAMLDELHKKSK